MLMLNPALLPRRFLVQPNNSLQIMFCLVPLGSIPKLPGESCSEIKASEEMEAQSAAYWLDDNKGSGNIIRVYCDMKTGGLF